MQTATRLAKLSRPHYSRFYKRTRLFEYLDHAADKPLIWIGAPAGSGKTVLVSSYYSEQDCEPLWFRADEGDNDIASFFYHLSLLGETLPEQDSDDAAEPLPLFTPEYAADPLTFARNFFRNLFARVQPPAVLVFDNVQEIAADSRLYDILVQALNEIPQGMKVVLISRSFPGAPFARMAASEAMLCLGKEELQLDQEEALGIARQLTDNPVLTFDDIQTIYQHTQGWVAGFVLILKFPNHIATTPSAPLNHQMIFDFFSNEVFSSIPYEHQQFLLKTALLPELTAEIAQCVTSIEDTNTVLDSLVLNQYFTAKHNGLPASYEYHPLFREFLLQKCTQLLSFPQRQAIQLQAANWLIQHGHHESALPLLLAAEDYAALTHALLHCAPLFIEQGRQQQLQHWLDTIPPQQKATSWLVFWRATAILLMNPVAARTLFEEALHGFEETQDQQGMFLSWAGIVDSFIFPWDAFHLLDAWISWMDTKLGGNVNFASPQVEARVIFGMFVSLMYRQPYHPDMALWANRVEQLLDRLKDNNQRIAMGGFYIHYLASTGDLAHAGVVLERLKPCAIAGKIQSVNLISFSQAEAIFHWLSADFTTSRQALERGLTLANANGIHIWDFALLVQSAYVGFVDATPAERQALLQRAIGAMNAHGRLHQSNYHYLASLEALLSHAPLQAREHAAKTLAICKESGSFFNVVLSHLALARALIELDEFDQAKDNLQQASEMTAQCKSHFFQFNIALTQAELAIKTQNTNATISALTEAMHLGRIHGYFHTDYWRPYAITGIAVHALKHGIEVAYVQQLIRRRKLQPASPPLDIPHWPWQLRIYTLGRFGIVIDDDALATEERSKNKPLLLLKALIAFGGREVGEETLCEALWPDAEGDVAHSAFTTNLSRLRKLLGHNTLIMKEGKLSLNDHLCWLDIWALERGLNELEQLSASDSPDLQTLSQKADAILALYKDRFLNHQQQASWMLGPRERLRLKTLRTLSRVIHCYEQQADLEKAAPLYEKALSLDELNESNYRGLMNCLADLGEPLKALSIYERCRSLFQQQFQMKPSTKTEQLYQKIKSSLAS